MFTVTGGKKNTILWDGAENKPLAHFKDGVFETEDAEVAKKLLDKGFSVEMPADFEWPEDETDAEVNDAIDLSGLTVEELRAYANAHGIDIGQATSQGGILKKIQEAIDKQ